MHAAFRSATSGILYLLPGDLGYFIRPKQYIIMMLMLTTGILTTIDLLELKKRAINYYRLLLSFLIPGAISMICGLTQYEFAANRLIELTGATVLLVHCLAAIKVYRTGNPHAIYVLFGWGTYLVVTIVMVLNVTGVIFLNDLYFYLLPSVACINFIFLTASILSRIRQYRLDKETAEQEKVKIIEQQNQLLEAQVAERTAELNKKSQEIALLNTSLEKRVEQKTTELRQSLESLLQQHKDLEQFSYVVSHNLRSPIASILGLSKILSSFTHIKDKNFEDIAKHIETSASSLDEVIKNLNAVISLKEPSQQHRKPVSLSAVLDTVTVLLEYEIRNSRAKISKDFTEIDEIFTVPAYIQNIFYNFISNSIKYQRVGVNPEIQIKSVLAPNFIVLTFADNGRGFEVNPENREKIFTLFEQLQSTSGRAGKGIGLYLVKTQIEMLNGLIEVSSEPGVGTTFSVFLPRFEKDGNIIAHQH